MTKKEFAPVTPGEMLKEEFLGEYGLSQNQLAKAIGISPNRITEIVNNRRALPQTLHSDSAFTLVIAQSSG
jgi:antitoxin HigA-1